MSAAQALKLYYLLRDAGIRVWLDGGWAVDALLGEQSRRHADLDIVVQSSDLPRLRELLGARGYSEQARDDSRPWNFVLADGAGLELDVHAIELDAQGNGIYGPPERGEMYPAGSLTGSGTINGKVVCCIGAAELVLFHTGYPPGAKDHHDVRLLCRKFNLALPAEYGQLPD